MPVVIVLIRIHEAAPAAGQLNQQLETLAKAESSAVAPPMSIQLTHCLAVAGILARKSQRSTQLPLLVVNSIPIVTSASIKKMKFLIRISSAEKIILDATADIVMVGRLVPVPIPMMETDLSGTRSVARATVSTCPGRTMIVSSAEARLIAASIVISARSFSVPELLAAPLTESTYQIAPTPA